MRWVVLAKPHLGGTTHFVRRLRRGLGETGIDVASASFEAPDEKAAFLGLVAACGHVSLHWASTEPRARVAQLNQWLLDTQTDGVIINVFCEVELMNAARFVPKTIARVMVVHSTSVATFRAARALADYVDFIVAPSERIAAGIKRRTNNPGKVVVIPHGVDEEFFEGIQPVGGSERLRVGYIGRLSDLDKGVLYIPEILRRVKERAIQVVIVGNGPDEERLRSRLCSFGGPVEFVGSVPWERLPGILGEIDVVLVPSRFEGFCQVIAESMAAGRVVVASRIRGVTDQVIEDGQNGFLFNVGDVRTAAALVDELARKRWRLAEIGARAKQTARERFSLRAFAEQYQEIMRLAKKRCPEERRVDRIERWDLLAGLRAGWRAYVPETLKRHLRLWREHLVK